MSNFDFYPGRFELLSVELSKDGSGINMTPMVLEINQNSSIVDSSVLVEFTVSDSRGVLSTFPIDHGDRLDYTLKFSGETKDFTVFVNKIESIENLESKRIYTIQCVSLLEFTSYTQRISRSFQGTSSDIAKSVFSEYSVQDLGLWEQSLGNQQLVVPFKSPVEVINMMSKRSRSIDTNSLMYFFQDSNHRYNFCSLEALTKMYKGNPIDTYVYNSDTSSKNGIPNSESVRKEILDLTYLDTSDVRSRVHSNGIVGGLTFTDITTGTFHTYGYDYVEEFNPDDRLNDKPLFENKVFPTGGGNYHHENLQTNTNSLEYNRKFDNSLIKRGQLNTSESIEITVKGNTVLDIGKVVEVLIPSVEVKNDQQSDPFDNRYSGKYLIVAKRDLYQNNEHSSIMILSKDSRIEGNYE